MALGLTVPLPDLGVRESAELAGEAELHGYKHFWSYETSRWDAFGPLHSIAASTQHAVLGTAIANVFYRSLPLLAMEAACIADMSRGRFILGLGPGSSITVRGWAGVAFAQPVSRTSEMVRAVQHALTGARTDIQGKTVSSIGFRLDEAPDCPIPIYVGASTEKGLLAATRVADGLIVNWLSLADVRNMRTELSDHHVAPKAASKLPIVARIPVICCDIQDRPRALDDARRRVTGRLTVPTYRRMQSELGRAAQLADVWAAWDAGDRQGALAAVPEQIIEELFVIGDAETCARRIHDYILAGVDVAVLAVNVAERQRAQTGALREAILEIGEQFNALEEEKDDN